MIAQSGEKAGFLTRYNRQLRQADEHSSILTQSVDTIAMSAHPILGLYKVRGSGCSPVKRVRELGSERRETVRSPI